MNRKEEIRKELAEIAPFLAGLELRPAFKVPTGYFEELPESVLESVSPLATLKKESAFSVPKDYFQSLPDLVLERVAPQQDTATEAAPTPAAAPSSNWLDDLINSIAVLFQPRYAMRLATVAVLLIAGFVFLNSPPDVGSIEEDPGELALIEAYGINLDDLTDEDLDLLLSEEVADTEIETSDEIDDAMIDELLEGLDNISDEDLEGFM